MWHVYPEGGKKLTGDMIAIFKYLKGCQMEGGAGLYFATKENRTRINRFKLQEKRF